MNDPIDYPDIPMNETGGPQTRQAAALERIATALEQIVLDRLGEGLPSERDRIVAAVYPRNNPGPDPKPFLEPALRAAAGPVGPEPPFSGPSPEFRQSRDLPAEAFVNLATWQCPVHHASKVVPAGVSKSSGKPYDAFVACPEYGCSEKPPRPVRR